MGERMLYGVWDVTTEGDEEGKSVKTLGAYEGYIDDIALFLADQAYYKLMFRRTVKVIKQNCKPTSEKVIVSIPEELCDGSVNYSKIAKLFENRPVDIKRHNYYKSVELISKDAEEIRRNKAMSKLSDEDKAVLGLLNE